MTAYYTKKDPSIYHVCKNCKEGNNIEKGKLVPGRAPGAKLCKRCADLQREGECAPGTPTPAG